MVNNGTSRAHITTVRRQITLRVFFNPKNDKKSQYGQKKQKNVDFREKIFEKLHASHQSWKKQKLK